MKPKLWAFWLQLANPTLTTLSLFPITPQRWQGRYSGKKKEKQYEEEESMSSRDKFWSSHSHKKRAYSPEVKDEKLPNKLSNRKSRSILWGGLLWRASTKDTGAWMRMRAEFKVTANLHMDIREDSLVDKMCHAFIYTIPGQCLT